MGKHRFIAILVIFYLYSVVVLSISIENNAYRGISISFSPELQEHSIDFQKLKAVLIKSSEFLYHATRKRSYFKEFIISSPLSWTEDMCDALTVDLPPKVDVYVTDSGTEPRLRAQHSGGCESEGDTMYMPLSWLQGDTLDLARQFVQQWSIYRYGVFEEDSLNDGLCYRSRETWSPVGCYDAKIEAEPTFEYGLPVCHLGSDSIDGEQQLLSSLMFTNNFSKALDFCDGSAVFPHNPAMPTLHNSLCEGRTVWSVIENSKDFKYGRNLPMKDVKPPTHPTFNCFREEPIHLTFAIQNSTCEKDLTYPVAELGSSLHHFLSSLQPLKVSVNAVMFSDREDVSTPVELDMTNEKVLESQIAENVKTFRVVSNSCLHCGFQKALNASQMKSHTSSIIVLVAWESAIADDKPSRLLSIIQGSTGTQLNLILIEDTDADVLSADFVEAIRSTGGCIYFLPKKHVFMASKLHGILSGIVKKTLQVEDNIVLVHEATYENIESNFLDSFTTLNGEVGKIVYLIFCDPIQKVRTMNQNCSYTKTTLDTFKCSEDLKSSPDSASMKKWEFTHVYSGGTVPPTCSSVAMLFRDSTSKNGFTLRGWLNKYAIRGGYDALIVYAETITSSPQRYQVKARITGPENFSITIELRDNGNGDPDVKLGDRIYSRYFTPPSLKKGSYIVTISAETASEVIEDKLHSEDESLEVPNQRQTKTIGFFSVTESAPDADILPPNRVADLRVVSINHDNGTITLQWTAPGNDYDNGTATSYEIKCAMHSASLSNLYFNDEENIPLTPRNQLIPSSSGRTERVEFSMPNRKDTTYFVALRATDADKNHGKISNTIQIYINTSQTVIEPQKSSTKVTGESSTVPSASTEIENNTTDITNTTLEITSENTAEPETSTALSKNENFFDKKFIILASSAGGILLLIIIINILVCCCCRKKREDSSKPNKISRKASLRPPYNLNIAYQEDSLENNDAERDVRSSVSTQVDQNIYTEPHSRKSSSRQRYSYHTSRSLLNKGNSPDDNELGFKLVQALPAYSTSSSSHYTTQLNDDSETDSDVKMTVAQPQQPSNATHIYPLGMV